MTTNEADEKMRAKGYDCQVLISGQVDWLYAKSSELGKLMREIYLNERIVETRKL